MPIIQITEQDLQPINPKVFQISPDELEGATPKKPLLKSVTDVLKPAWDWATTLPPVTEQPYAETMYTTKPDLGLVARSRKIKEELAKKGEVLKTGEPSLWQEKVPAISPKDVVPGMGQLEKVLTGQPISPETIIEPMAEAAQMFLGGKVIGAVAGKLHNWFRMLMNKERALILPSPEQLSKMNPEILTRDFAKINNRVKELGDKGYTLEDIKIQLAQEGNLDEILTRWRSSLSLGKGRKASYEAPPTYETAPPFKMKTPTPTPEEPVGLPPAGRGVFELQEPKPVLRSKPPTGKVVEISPEGEPVYPRGMKPVEQPLPLTEIQKMQAPVITTEGKTVGMKPKVTIPPPEIVQPGAKLIEPKSIEKPGATSGGKQPWDHIKKLPGEDIARAESDGTITVDPDKFFGHSAKDQADIIAHEKAHFVEEKISPEYKARLFDNTEVMNYRGRNINEKLANMIQDGKLPPEVMKDYPELQPATVPPVQTVTEPPVVTSDKLTPSGLSPASTYFNTPQDRFEGYAWRSMGEKEYQKLLNGEITYGGSQAKKGNYLAPTPESASQYQGLGKVMVEFGGVEKAEGETISNIVGKENITQVWELKGDKWGKKGVTQPELSATAKDQYSLLPVGLEMKGAKKVTPTLEGSPLMEAIVKAEREKVQPKLGLGELKTQPLEQSNPELYGTIQELQGIVKRGEPGKRTFTESRTENMIVGGYGSSYPTFMRDKGWTKDEVLLAIDKGLSNQKLGVKQQQIWKSVQEEAKGIISDKNESLFKESRNPIRESDPDFLKDNTFNDLTNNYDDEIMSIREELRESGYPDAEANKVVTEVEKAYRTQTGPPDLEAIQKRISNESSPTQQAVDLLKSEKGVVTIPIEEIKRSINRIREFWSPFSTLPQRQQLLSQRGKALGDMARTERIIKHVVDRTKNLSDQDKLEIFEAMDARRDLATMRPEISLIAKELITVNDIVGKMLVQRDLISQKAYDAHKGEYIRYAYLKHILGDETPIPVKPNGKLDLSYAKSRKDLTLEQRKTLGLVEDVSIAEPLGLAKSLTDIAKYDYLEKLAQDPRNVWTPSIVNIADMPREYSQPMAQGQATRLSRVTGDPHQATQLPSGSWGVINTTTNEMVGKSMGIGDLAKETELYKRMHRENPQSQEILDRLNIYERYLEKAKQATQNVPEDFIKLSESPHWGPLSGSFIRKEIARDLMSFYGKETGNIQGLTKAIDFMVDLDQKATAAFKVAKVPLNIPTMARNTVSNVIQLHMSGIHPWEIPGYVVKAGKSMLDKDSLYVKAFRNGLFKTNWSVTEINEVMDQFRYLKGDSWGKIIEAAQHVAKYYGRIDDIFKMAKLTEQTDKGVPFEKAIQESQRWGMDYSLADPSIRWARKHFIPFASYQAKIAPLVVETAIKRPWVLGMYLAAPVAIAETVRQIYKGQMTDDNWKELERTIPAEVTRRQSFMIVPWKIKDKWYWFDYSYFLPWGNFLNAGSSLKEGDIKGALNQFGIGGTPLLTLFKTFTSSSMRNEPPKDAFSGYPIYNQLDTPLDKALKTSEYLYNQFAPSMLTRYGALGYTLDIGKEDRYGRIVPMQQAVGKLFGVNIHEANPQLAGIVQKAKLNALKDEYMKIMLDPKISVEKKERYAERFQEEINLIVEPKGKSILPSGILRQSAP